MSKTNAQSIVDSAYETRLVAMIETHAGSNQYRQIGLNEKQFKQFSDLLADFFLTEKDGDKEVLEFNMSDWTAELPENIQSSYYYEDEE